jgi:hypothetical protein
MRVHAASAGPPEPEIGVTREILPNPVTTG